MLSRFSLPVWCIIILATACRSPQSQYYYDEEVIEYIDSIRQSDQYIFLDYRFIKPTPGNIRKYADLPVKRTIHYRKFRNRKPVFALYGQSTANGAVLDRVVDGKLQRLDSTHCAVRALLLLQMDTLQRGSYRIKAWGCRFHQQFEITIR
jgi:hypothetical protein